MDLSLFETPGIQGNISTQAGRIIYHLHFINIQYEQYEQYLKAGMKKPS